MEEVSVQEALAGGERTSAPMLEAGVDDICVLNRETLPWMWEAEGACVLRPDGTYSNNSIGDNDNSLSACSHRTVHSSHLVSSFFIWASVLVSIFQMRNRLREVK